MKHNNKGFSSFIQTWTARVLCFLVAIIIFAAINYFNMASRVVRIPLEVDLPSSDEVVAESLVPTYIDIVISGDDNLIYLVNPDSITASADFSDVSSAGIVRRAVTLDYDRDVFNSSALTVKASPDVVRILFSESEN